MVNSQLKKSKINKQSFNAIDVLIYVVLALIAATMIIPFMNIISISLSDYASAVTNKTMLVPHNINFNAYESLLSNVEVYRSIFLTAFVVVANTTIHILLCMMAAYTLSKNDLPGRKILLLYVLFTMLFSGGTIPTYILTKSLGLTDNILVYILPGVVSGFTVILMKNFIKQIPIDLEEAALVDGANYFKILFSIVFPLSKPIIATMALFNGVGVWNNWFAGVLYISNKKLYLIQNVLREMLIEGNLGAMGNLGLNKSYESSVKMAAIIIATIPIVAIFPFMQKYFEKGMFIGSVKG